MEGLRFDVFLCHHSADDAVVEHIAERLRGKGIQPWLDRWALTPGCNWQQEISQGLRASRACAVFVGLHGLGDWAREELAVAQDRATKDRDFRLFMVLLPGALRTDDPSLDFLANRQWIDLRDGIDDPHSLQALRSAITDVGLHAAAVTRTLSDSCPYRGLEVFDEAHAEFFFGRDDDTQRVIEKLKDSRFLAVLGPSGCGKSSLVRAGVIPALKDGALPASQTWAVRLITPTARPLSRLAAELARLFPQESRLDMLDRLRTDEQTLDLAVSLALAERPDDEQMVLIVDQFEEVFTLCADETERTALLANLCYAGTIPGGRLVVVVALRADFYHRCASYPQLGALMAARQFLVSPLGPEGLRQTIEQPARRAGLELEAGLAETILGDVVNRPGSLPLLEHVLLEIWQRRQGRMLTLKAYVASGRVDGALAQRANTIYEGLRPAQQQIARRVLLRLIQPGEGTEDTRRRAQAAELLTRPDEESDLEAVVKVLADGRLVTTGRDEVTGARMIDVAHEALIRGWPQLRTWIDGDRELLRAHRRLTEAAAEWDHDGRDEELLYGRTRLAYWENRQFEDLNDLERAFLAASQEHEAHERAAARQRVRLALIGLSTALAAISALAVLALFQYNRASDQRDLAFSRQLAASATVQLPLDPELSLLLAREAFEVSPTDEAEAALRQATLSSRVRATLSGHEGPIYSAAFSPDGQRVASTGEDGTVRVWNLSSGHQPAELRGHQGVVHSVAFSPDGQQVASAGEDSTVRVWNLAGRTDPVVLGGHNGQVNRAAFSPDGQQVASASEDGIVRVWDLSGERKPMELRGHQGPVYSVGFSFDGQRVASAGDGTVRVWDLAGRTDPVVLDGHRGGVRSAAFSPDGQRVASASGDGTVRIWDLSSEREPAVLQGHVGTAHSVAFSPDGRWVASAGDDGAVRVSDAGRGEPLTLRGHQGPVWSAAFSPDGRRVASAGQDGTIRIWESPAEAGPMVLRSHTDQTVAVAFSPEGQRVTSAGYDGIVRVWDLAGGGQPLVLAGHQGRLWGVAFSPDGQWVASAGHTDHTVRVWDLAGGGQPLVLTGHQDSVWSVAFSPDGQRVASAGEDSTVRVWDLAGGGQPLVLTGHQGTVRGVTFGPDEQQVASVGDDGTVRVWDLSGRADPVVLHGHRGAVRGVAFGPDGQRVASAGFDATVRVWDLAGGGQPLVLTGHQGTVNGAAFSPDGRLIVSAGGDGTVRVWNLAGASQPVVLTGHQGSVYGVAFSPEGRRVASVGIDGAVRVWECEVCGPIEEVLALSEQRVSRELTAEERAAFLHEPQRA